MAHLRDWYQVRFDEQEITLAVSPPGQAAWTEVILWEQIVQVCFEAGEWLAPDTLYIFTAQRPESYPVPVEAGGGQGLWGEIIRRNLFDAELAIKAATASNEIFCSPVPVRPEAASRVPLTSPDRLVSPGQLPDLEGETLVLTWDQLEFDSLILHGAVLVWREHTGWEVYDRFEEMALILKQKYGARLLDLVPTRRSLYALYGDSIAASAHVEYARKALRG